MNDAIDNVVNRAGTVTGTASNDQGVGAVTGASLTLTDDEGAPTATLVLSSSSISESGGVATVMATLSGASSAAVTLTGGGFGERLHAVEREDADHRVGADGEHGRGDRDGGRRHDGLAGQDGDGSATASGGGVAAPGERDADHRR